jgi:hypothetical protein
VADSVVQILVEDNMIIQRTQSELKKQANTCLVGYRKLPQHSACAKSAGVELFDWLLQL